jgi:leucine dehydrogenase
METDYVTGLAGRSGDPSPVTAHGVFRAIQAAAKERWNSDDVSARTVALQGCGHVGYYLAKELHEAGAKLIVTDIDPERVKRVTNEFGARAVGSEEIYSVQADVFAPCALGAIINDKTIPQLKVEIVAGAANNVLLEERHGDALEKKGILYAPDYAVNAGGLMNVSLEIDGYNRERAMRMMRTIYDNVSRIFQIARRDGIPTYRAADRVAEERISQIGKIKLPTMGNHAPRFQGRMRGQ